MKISAKNHGFFLLGASLLVFCTVIWFFTPRFAVWTALDVPPVAQKNPETDRASWAVRQVDDPFMAISDVSNAPIRWRLLFPLLAHYLHFPNFFFLMLPHLGALLAIGIMIHMTLRESAGRMLGITTAALMSTGSWFFVSTGWLAYFDSWYLIGLLIVSFVETRWILMLTCLLSPWVDERFIFALPLCMMVRASYFDRIVNHEARKLRNDCLLCLACIMPYVAARLAAMSLYDSESLAYMGRRVAYKFKLTTCISGIWAGLRATWIFVMIHILFSLKKKRPLWNSLTLLIPALSIVEILYLSGDYSRSMSMLLPGALSGVWLLFRSRWDYRWHLLLGALAMNLLLPAHHVVGSFTKPIYYIYQEISRYQNPPDLLTGIAQYRDGMEKEKKGDIEGAIADYDLAIRLNENNATAYAQRGTAKSKLGLWKDAVDDYYKALEVAPPSWTYRSRVEKMLHHALEMASPQDP